MRTEIKIVSIPNILAAVSPKVPKYVMFQL